MHATDVLAVSLEGIRRTTQRSEALHWASLISFIIEDIPTPTKTMLITNNVESFWVSVPFYDIFSKVPIEKIGEITLGEANLILMGFTSQP
jgi:hypothetical protein